MWGICCHDMHCCPDAVPKKAQKQQSKTFASPVRSTALWLGRAELPHVWAQGTNMHLLRSAGQSAPGKQRCQSTSHTTNNRAQWQYHPALHAAFPRKQQSAVCHTGRVRHELESSLPISLRAASSTQTVTVEVAVVGLMPSTYSSIAALPEGAVIPAGMTGSSVRPARATTQQQGHPHSSKSNRIAAKGNHTAARSTTQQQEHPHSSRPVAPCAGAPTTDSE